MGMRRADRLFQIIQYLRGNGLVTAAKIAKVLAVSERTIYRDIRDLVASGVPIEGEAGVGYVLRRGFDLPPLMFDRQELEALVVGARMLHSWCDEGMGRAIDQALEKIEAVLPRRLRGEFGKSSLFVPDLRPYPVHLVGSLRHAIDHRLKVRMSYTKPNEEHSVRKVLPLGLFFWGSAWTLLAWCELRDDHRNFRVDRMDAIDVLDEIFETLPGRSLEDFLDQMNRTCGNYSSQRVSKEKGRNWKRKAPPAL